MITFFDTCVHIALLRGELTVDAIQQKTDIGPVRMSPIVASELLRGSRRDGRKTIEGLIANLRTIEPASWRTAFLAAGRILPDVFSDHESIGLAQLQNDTLLALTARNTGARLITRDRHFSTLQAKLSFPCVVL